MSYFYAGPATGVETHRVAIVDTGDGMPELTIDGISVAYINDSGELALFDLDGLTSEIPFVSLVRNRIKVVR